MTPFNVHVVRHIMTRQILIPLAIVCLACCHSSSNSLADQTGVVQPNSPDSAIHFDSKKAFEVVNTRAVSDYPSSDADTLQCQAWSLGQEQIKEAIAHGQPITGTEWDLSFAHYPCAIIADIRQNGNDFSLALNAGSWFIVKSADETVRFGIYDPKVTKLFLSHPAEEADQK